MIKRDVDPQYLSLYPYYGRHSQDKYLHEEIFGNVKGNTFVDIGAYDGVESNNTLFFEETLGWNGICVEPLPNIFPKLISNRKSICLNKCALDRHGKAVFQHVIPDRKKGPPAEGRRSNIEKLSGLVEFYSNDHREMMNKMILKEGGISESIEVECIPINDILSQLPSRINLLSIDTEGSEFHILQSIDFSRFEIDVIVVEMLFPHAAFSRFMKEHRYDFIKTVGYDWIYKKK